jgi:hypothetical protein
VIADIRRETHGLEGIRVVGKHFGVNLQITDSKVSLSGAKFGFIAEGEVRQLNTTYTGSGYHIMMVVDRRFDQQHMRFKREMWWVYFHEQRKNQ